MRRGGWMLGGNVNMWELEGETGETYLGGVSHGQRADGVFWLS